MENENIEKTQVKIPYLSASKMGKLMELISERSLINITAEYFKNYGFGQVDAYLAINTLKFLGVIDDNSKATNLLRKFQLRGDTRNIEVQGVLKTAYQKLFDTVNEPQKLSKDDLTNEFMHHYALSRRVAISAVPAFLKLCEFAGLVEQGSVLTRKRNTNQSTKIQKSKKEYPELRNFGDDKLAVIPIAHGRVELRLPYEILTKIAFGGEIADDIKALTQKISDFADKYCKNNETDNEV